MEPTWRTTFASLTAVLQTIGGGLSALIGVTTLLDGDRSYVPLTMLGASLFIAAVGIAYLCRVDAARLFLAGECAVIVLASIVVLLGLAVERTGCASAVLLVPAALGALGATVFVSADVRAWCRR